MNPKEKRLYYPKIRTYAYTLLFLLGIFLCVKVFTWGQKFAQNTGLSPVTIVRLLFDSGAPLKNMDGRTNILLLGIGGGTHDGADLTDTMMVISLNKTNRAMALLSIPRDIWSDTLKDKINSAYHYGELKKQGGGLILSEAIMEDVVGIPIHYGLLVDFSGFEEVINLAGGIHVSVPEAFTDTKFPIQGKENDDCGGDPEYACRYESVRFEAGKQSMDGKRALTYVRSRHAQGDEGSDFARGRRQQDILLAIKEKLTSLQLWISPSRARALFDAFDKATDTDMNPGELITVGKTLSRVAEGQIKKISIDQKLVSPPLWEYGRYVLVPQEDYTAVHEYIQKELP